MSAESAVLEWKNYTPTATMAFQKLYDDTTYTDVTIACEGNKKIEAHKVVLNMCSNLFSNILKDNPNPHPLIYLQDISIEDLNLLKKFMYKGKATVLKGQLDSFMKLSKTFLNYNQESTSADQHTEIKECMKTFDKEDELSKMQFVNPPDVDKQPEKIKELHSQQPNDIDFFPIKSKQEKLKCSLCYFSTLYTSKLTKHNKKMHREKPCPTCKIELEPKLLRKHVKQQHTIFTCEHCSFSTRFGSYFRVHNRKHNGQMIHCDQCDYSCAKNTILQNHMESIHHTSEYNCDSCDFRTHTARIIKFHKEKVHLGIRHFCEHCNYKAAKLQNLRTHQLTVHAKVRYNCQICKFGDSQKSRVKLHSQRKHGISFEEHNEI